jgi:[acyl-carrier-protein] S-malonyltransferase
MGEPWRDHPSWELVAEASEAAGRDVDGLLLTADAETLRQTRNAQLSTFVLSMVVLDAVTRVGVDAAGHAGHSLGEYSALTASGALDFADAVRLVTERGDAMQVAAEDREGTMAAVLGLDDDDCDVACRRADGNVWVANFNAPGQVVISGSHDGVAAASAAAKELGAKKVMPIPVGGAFHTPYMAPARDELRKAIDAVTFRSPDVPVIANVDARPHDDADEWSKLLSAQLISPVRWRQSVQRLAEDGVTKFVELGPGSVLTGTVKRIAPTAKAIAVNTPADLDTLLEALSGEQPHPINIPEGEHLFTSERMIVSPAAGVFAPAEPWASRPEGRIEVGDLVGTIGTVEVRSLFAGQLMGLIAVDGERVTASQPIAWLRTL